MSTGFSGQPEFAFMLVDLRFQHFNVRFLLNFSIHYDPAVNYE